MRGIYTVWGIPPSHENINVDIKVGWLTQQGLEIVSADLCCGSVINYVSLQRSSTEVIVFQSLVRPRLVPEKQEITLTKSFIYLE